MTKNSKRRYKTVEKDDTKEIQFQPKHLNKQTRSTQIINKLKDKIKYYKLKCSHCAVKKYLN